MKVRDMIMMSYKKLPIPESESFAEDMAVH